MPNIPSIEMDTQFHSTYENWEGALKTVLNFKPRSFKIRQGCEDQGHKPKSGLFTESKPVPGISLWSYANFKLKPRQTSNTDRYYICRNSVGNMVVVEGSSATEAGLIVRGLDCESDLVYAASAVGPFSKEEAREIVSAMNTLTF